jgi:hypothetical protein
MTKPQRVPTVDVTASARRAAVVFAVVSVAGAIPVAISLVLPRITPWDFLTDPASPAVRFVDVRAEANLHTWFNVAVFVVGAGIHACAALFARRAGRPWWPWAVTSVLLVVLSVDDLASLHEQLEPVGRAVGGGTGAFHFAWLLPGLVLAAGFLVAALAGIRRVPVVAAHWLMIGVATLLAAAVGFEALGGLVLSSIGDGPAYILLSHLEEFGETCAAAMLLAAAVSAVSVQQGGASGSLEFAYLDRSTLGQQRS